MKKFISIIVFLGCVLSINAYGYSDYGNVSSALSWYDILSLIIYALLLYGVYKFYQLMIKAMKNINKMSELLEKNCPNNIIKFPDNVYGDSFPELIMRRNLCFNSENIKQSLIYNCFAQIENDYQNEPRTKLVNDKWESINATDIANKPITKYINDLKISLEKINESIPSYIENMKTYKDYFEFFKTDNK